MTSKHTELPWEIRHEFNVFGPHNHSVASCGGRTESPNQEKCYQENKANQSLLALKKMVKIRTKVWRDGNEKEIDSEELVVGDVVLLKSGLKGRTKG